jgi:hypothetical protein
LKIRKQGDYHLTYKWSSDHVSRIVSSTSITRWFFSKTGDDGMAAIHYQPGINLPAELAKLGVVAS